MKLNVGDKMPDFQFHTGYQEGLSVNKVLKGKTIFWVLRYIGCTSCRYDVHLISQRYDEITAKGAQVFVVMQSDPEHIQREFEKFGSKPPFEIICDESQEIYKTLEIPAPENKEEMRIGVDPEKMAAKRELIRASGFTHGDYEGNENQLPAMFIVDEEGTVVYSHYAKNMMDMPTVDGVLELLG